MANYKAPPIRGNPIIGTEKEVESTLSLSGEKMKEGVVKTKPKRQVRTSKRKKQSKFTLKHDIDLVQKAMSRYGQDMSGYVNLCIGLNLISLGIGDK